MAEAEEKREASHDSRQRNGYPGDLLQKFISGGYFPGRLNGVADEKEKEEEIELSLGLSLNGRFGVDPKRAKKLSRSSSISDFVLTKGDKKAASLAPPAAYAPLIRTCSLPTETEEEWRKRKEIQTLRRMEAKRKRLEKMKNVRTVRDQVSLEANYEENSQLQSQGSVINGHNEFLLNPTGWVSGVTQQGSGSSGSGTSESENQPTQGTNGCIEARSPASIQSKPAVILGSSTEKSIKPDSSAKLTGNNNEAKEIRRNMMTDMPCVTTREAGPDGKRIEGLLYKYRKGEQVKIVCVCHGNFLSPAEFVKHAGGGEVTHPLRHIVVKPSPLM